MFIKVIKPGQTKLAPSICFATMKDGSVRLYVDYRKLYGITLSVSPIPRVGECINFLGYATIFFAINNMSCYWQLEILGDDVGKIVLTSNQVQYQCYRMHFERRYVPMKFQLSIDMILSYMKWQYALVYLNDVAISSPKSEEHIFRVRIVLKLLREAVATRDPQKCKLLTDRINN